MFIVYRKKLFALGVFLCLTNILFCQVSPIENIFEQKITYSLSTEPIDVVFVTHPKDLGTLELAIAGIRKNGINIRRIIVVSSHKLTNSAEWFDEAAYPFSKYNIALEIFKEDHIAAQEYMQNKNTRIGWIYQQILKLYTPFVIPEISSNVLVIDADTMFLNPVNFMDEQGNPFFNTSVEHTQEYFDHGARLLPGFKKIYPKFSGVTNYMLFQQPILQDLFQIIQTLHQTEPWRALCRCIDHKDLFSSGLSEYELYFNFTCARTDQAQIRRLLWKSISFDEVTIAKYQQEKFHYVTCHLWMQEWKQKKLLKINKNNIKMQRR